MPTRQSTWACIAIAAFAVALPSSARASADEELAHALDLHRLDHDDAVARALLAPLAASPDAPVAARAEEILGEIDEAAFDYPKAIAHYATSLAKDSSGSAAAAAKARYDVLASYGGDLGDLSRLDVVRDDPAKANDRTAVDALAASAASFKGKPRDEALLFVAEAYVGRFHDPARAIAPALVAARDPSCEPLVRTRAFEVAYEAMFDVGALDQAERDIAHDPSAPPSLVARIARDLRRRALHRASLAVAAVGALTLVYAAIEAARRRRLDVLRRALLHPLAIAFLALATAGGYVLAERWQRGDGRTFLVLGAALLGVHALVAAWRGGFGDRPAKTRALGAVIAATCVVALAYLVAERNGGAVLAGFGL